MGPTGGLVGCSIFRNLIQHFSKYLKLPSSHPESFKVKTKTKQNNIMNQNAKQLILTPIIPHYLTLLFITLKLTKVIDWSWWWVMSPMWILFGFILMIILAISVFLGTIVVVNVLIEKHNSTKHTKNRESE